MVIENDIQHKYYGTQDNTYQNKSTNSFMKSTKYTWEPLKKREKIGNETVWIMSIEKLVPGHNNKWVIWRSLNGLQTKVGQCKNQSKRVGLFRSIISGAWIWWTKNKSSIKM